ncbi:hypothetical protein TrVE_jg12996 [Triparma verrucosa]|uniref:RGS domain-containing protein n=1 Tax=Triparma verrucosa TaxID=1606542 RepID=A0A9W7B1K3_9STRA|nr:hypothetical protein TrVE_jg12996 [Triparma verrucosa]
MGGGGSKPSPLDLQPAVHVPKKGWTGKVVKGGFSAGPRTMEKIRTRSDFCLLKIVEQETVRKAFALWAHAENVKEGATYLDFVLDVNDMKNESNIGEQKMKLLNIFTTYIPRSSKKSLLIDSATRKTIMLAFESFVYDSKVFDLAYEKAYQCLKFDHMPQFLISDSFMKLEQGTQVRRGSSSKVIELRSILSEPRANKALAEFLKENNKVQQILFMKMWENINDFSLDYDKQDAEGQNKRAKNIWESCQKQVKLPSHLRAITNENVTGNVNTKIGPGKDCFDDLSNFLCDTLQSECQRPFLVSKHYNDFLGHASDEYKLDSVVMTLSEFKDDRQLKQTKEEYVNDLNLALKLENVLEDPLLSSYFRRFLRVSFCEENFLFFQDIQDLKEQYFILEGAEEETKEAMRPILQGTAKKIFEKYIQPGAALQVNISASVKEDVNKEVERETIKPSIYDAAQREIFLQMRSGGFMEFKKHDLFNHFKQAHKRKFAQRNFAVGFKPKSNKISEFAHYKLRRSQLNFDEVAEADKNFSFENHAKARRQEIDDGPDYDMITKANIADFEKDMGGLGLEMEEKKEEGGGV